MGLIFFILFIGIFICLTSIKQIDQYERGIKFTKGKFDSIMEPGWNFVMPIFQSYKKVDIRTKAVDVPSKRLLQGIMCQ